MLGVWCGAGGGHLAGEPEKTSQGSFPVRGGGEGVRGQSWDGRTLGADALENKTLGPDRQTPRVVSPQSPRKSCRQLLSKTTFGTACWAPPLGPATGRTLKQILHHGLRTVPSVSFPTERNGNPESGRSLSKLTEPWESPLRGQEAGPEAKGHRVLSVSFPLTSGLPR